METRRRQKLVLFQANHPIQSISTPQRHIAGEGIVSAIPRGCYERKRLGEKPHEESTKLKEINFEALNPHTPCSWMWRPLLYFLFLIWVTYLGFDVFVLYRRSRVPNTSTVIQTRQTQDAQDARCVRNVCHRRYIQCMKQTPGFLMSLSPWDIGHLGSGLYVI